MSYKCTQRDDGKTATRPHSFYKQNHLGQNAIAIDETCFYINDTQRKGWSDKNTRLKTPKMLSRVKMSTMLAIDRKGIVATETIKGNFNSISFAKFLTRVPKNKKLVLDNVAFHKSKIVKSVAEDRDIDLCFTPPYCPWFNPVEFAFSVIKTRYRRLNVRHSGCMETLITDSIDGMTTSSCNAFFDMAKNRVDKSLSENPNLGLV
jgi:transposase